jgi:hypothetical protein
MWSQDVQLGNIIKAPLESYCFGVSMDRIATDILGIFPVTKRKNTYILVVMDYFSKWVEVV